MYRRNIARFKLVTLSATKGHARNKLEKLLARCFQQLLHGFWKMCHKPFQNSMQMVFKITMI